MIYHKAVKNVRYGLATNSSSTHSIIHNAEIKKDSCVGDMTYGWEFFVAASKEEKKSYLIQQFIANMNRECKEMVHFLGKQIGCKYAVEAAFSGSIDHQSVISFPRSKYGMFHIEFFEEYMDYIVENDFVILGGNDNTEEPPPLYCKDDNTKDSYFYDFYDNDITYKNGNYWVVANTKRKIRVIFNDEEPKPEYPELIDLKITDYCDIGCSFCYQASTEEGAHADFENLRMLFEDYSDRFYEFAIGGGEPTKHPEFPAFIRRLKSKGHIVNFTTRSKEWHDDDEIVEAVKNGVSGVAYSVNSVDEVKEFRKSHESTFELDDVSVYYHVIPELIGGDELEKIIEYLDDKYYMHRESITLLGYKTTGRGGKHPGKVDGLIEIIKKAKNVRIGIDTKIAQDYKSEIESAGISKKLYTDKEGEFSMYVDLVNLKAYKSSYELEEPVEIIDKSYSYLRFRDIKDIFKDIRES